MISLIRRGAEYPSPTEGIPCLDLPRLALAHPRAAAETLPPQLRESFTSFVPFGKVADEDACLIHVPWVQNSTEASTPLMDRRSSEGNTGKKEGIVGQEPVGVPRTSFSQERHERKTLGLDLYFLVRRGIVEK